MSMEILMFHPGNVLVSFPLLLHFTLHFKEYYGTFTYHCEKQNYRILCELMSVNNNQVENVF